jgi:SAM-dependent methyltransferase
MKGTQEKKIEGILHHVEPEGRILDIGSGPGFLRKFIEGAYFVDVDVENLRKIEGIRVIASGDCLPFKPESFATVFCIDTIHLLKNAEEIKRILSADGIAVFSTFCSSYDRQDKLQGLKDRLEDWKIEEEFFVGDRELDAVVVATKGLRRG